MFEQILKENAARTRRPLTVALSFTGQVLFVGLAVLLPVLHTEAISLAARPFSIITAPRPLGEPKPVVQRADPAAARTSTLPRPVFQEPVLRQPESVPNVVSMDAGPPVSSGAAGVLKFSGGSDGVPAGIGTSVFEIPKIAAPKPIPQTAVRAAPVRVGGVVQAAKLIHQVTPAYPTLARQARISGVVRLEAIINRNGTIQSLQVAAGHPLLVASALEAVRQWVYNPTLLNGSPVEVLTQIEVHFKLGE